MEEKTKGEMRSNTGRCTRGKVEGKREETEKMKRGKEMEKQMDWRKKR